MMIRLADHGVEEMRDPHQRKEGGERKRRNGQDEKECVERRRSSAATHSASLWQAHMTHTHAHTHAHTPPAK